MLAFRHWKRSQVVPGRCYRTGIDMVEVESMAAFPVYRIRIDRPDPRDELARSASLTEADVAAIHVSKLKELGLTLSLDAGAGCHRATSRT